MLGILLFLSCREPEAQVSFRGNRTNSIDQRSLPSTGPGSALLNPAALAEGHWAFGQLSGFRSLGGKDRVGYYQFSVGLPAGFFHGLPVGVSVGFGGKENDTRIDGSTALYEEKLLTPGLAVIWAADSATGSGVSAGAALPTHHMNAFNAVKTKSTSLDVGLLASLAFDGQRFRAGFAYHNLMKPEYKLPDGRGTYTPLGFGEFSLRWRSPDDRFQAGMEWFYREAEDPFEGPSSQDNFGINGWEAEVRPLYWMGFKLERTLDGSHTNLGLTFHPVLGEARFHAELNYSPSQGPPPPAVLFGEGMDEGRGSLVAFLLAAEI